MTLLFSIICSIQAGPLQILANMLSDIEGSKKIEIPEGLEKALFQSFKVAMKPKKYAL